ncbi:MAG: YciI family protein [Cyclobacteriaceae bacterium]
MKKFMLLIREDLHLIEQMTQEQSEADIQKMVSWVEEITQSGNFVQGDPLENGMSLVTKDEIISDGPFIEAKEAISGFTIIKAESLQQASEIASSCPLVQTGQIKMEVRPIMEF